MRIQETPPGVAWSGRPDVATTANSTYAVWVDDRTGDFSAFFTILKGTQMYGDGTGGSGGVVPALTGSGVAGLGETVTLDVTDGVGGAAGALLLGAGKATTPILGGTLLVAPVFAPPILLDGVAGSPGAGTTSLPLSLPASEAFVGASLFFQVLLLDAQAPQGVSMSNGVELWIG